MSNLTEREWRQAQDRGAAARQAGRPITAAPEYGSGARAQTLREAWEDAWREEDARRSRA